MRMDSFNNLAFWLIIVLRKDGTKTLKLHLH
jgi:hypothetical protein